MHVCELTAGQCITIVCMPMHSDIQPAASTLPPASAEKSSASPNTSVATNPPPQYSDASHPPAPYPSHVGPPQVTPSSNQNPQHPGQQLLQAQFGQQADPAAYPVGQGYPGCGQQSPGGIVVYDPTKQPVVQGVGM